MRSLEGKIIVTARHSFHHYYTMLAKRKENTVTQT